MRALRRSWRALVKACREREGIEDTVTPDGLCTISGPHDEHWIPGRGFGFSCPGVGVCTAQRFPWGSHDVNGHHCREVGPHDVHTDREHGCRWRDDPRDLDGNSQW